MYQYRAVLKSSGVLVTEAHNLEEIEKHIVHYRRNEGKGHKDSILIYHRKILDHSQGNFKEELIKTIVV